MVQTIGWIIAAIAFAVIEGATAALVSIWFAAGALAAAAVGYVTADLRIQIGVFLAVSVLSLTMVLRRRQGLSKSIEPTNADRLIGQRGVVLRRITETEPGLVKICSEIWSAVSEQGQTVEEGMFVEGVRIEGVKMVIRPCGDKHRNCSE